MKKFDWQTAGDIHRNTMSLELWDNSINKQVAEVTRYDETNSLKLSIHTQELDVDTIERLIALARKHLGGFEDGTPLSDAKISAQILP